MNVESAQSQKSKVVLNNWSLRTLSLTPKFSKWYVWYSRVPNKRGGGENNRGVGIIGGVLGKIVVFLGKHVSVFLLSSIHSCEQ